jgi:hypothetical protein
MFIALTLAAATSVSAMFGIVEADGCGRTFLCLSVRFSSALLLVARRSCLLNEAMTTGMIPCQACGDSPTDQSFFGVSLCRSCKMTLRANKPIDDATFTRDRIIEYCEDYQRLFRLRRMPGAL